MDIKARFGARLRDLRAQRRLSQEKLSELVPAGKLRATTDYAEAIPGADAVVIVEAALILEVTPQFTPDGRVRMSVLVEKNRAEEERHRARRRGKGIPMRRLR